MAFIDDIKKQIEQFESLLEPLKSGKFRIGESDDGRSWRDRTQAQVIHLEGIIKTLKSIVERG